ncbi:MAG: rhomboid family intramembrane serine protease [Treponema sp.]|jgi:membrane associated rhomboid family serine protease|nr:rhomboid family intramembrane serine protease [Treponema sp.]
MRIVNRSYQSSNVALILIGINVAVFALQQLVPMSSTYLAMNPLAVIGNKWVWQVFTYMFAHGSISHLLFNMLALFMFGTQVERYMGSAEFLCFYLITGFLAGAFSLGVYCLTFSYRVWLLGASGAIFAVQLAYATFFPNAVIAIWGILPLRAPVMVLVFTVIELASLFFGFQSSVAHLTHLAGFAFGWLYLLIRFRQNPWRALTGR